MKKSFASQNLNAIKKNHPEIAELIAKYSEEPSNLNLKIEKSRSGDVTLSALTDIKERIYLHSKYDPLKESEKIADSWQIRKTDTNILIIGFGLGYLPLCVSNRIDPAQRLFIVEPSIEIFLCGIKHLDLTPLLSRSDTNFFIGTDFFNKLKDHFSEIDFKTAFFTHQPSLSVFPVLTEAVSYLEGISLSKIKKELDYPKFKSKKPKVFLLETGFFIENELKNNFAKLEIPLATLSANVNDEVGDPNFIRGLLEKLTEFKPDFILSVNLRGFDLEGKLTELLTHYQIPFVCWHVDNPLPSLLRKNNNVSVYGLNLLWDDHYIVPMKKLGFEKIEYLPYAADSTVFYPSHGPISKKYSVSFVGNSLKNIIRKCLREMDSEKWLMEIYEKLSKKSPSTLNEQREVINLIKEEVAERSISAHSLSSLEIAINSKWTQDRRVKALLAIEEFKPHIFGDEGWNELLPSASFTLHPQVNYYRELPEIYKSTEINLNISNVQLRNSVNQRLFDVYASGSFLLTDRCSTAEKFLVPGEEMGTFESYDDLREKVEYFLAHPDEREKIAKRGCKVILERHTYSHRLEEIFFLCNKYFA